jgi:hypothetical protein
MKLKKKFKMILVNKIRFLIILRCNKLSVKKWTLKVIQKTNLTVEF